MREITAGTASRLEIGLPSAARGNMLGPSSSVAMKPIRILSLVALCGATIVSDAFGQGAPPAAPHPGVTLPRTQLRELRSDRVGQTYQLRIWLPEQYDSSAARFPVVYLLDGDLLFGTTSEVAQSLQWGGLLPPVIIVAPSYGSIHSPANGGTNMRTRDYSMFPSQSGYVAGGGAKFMAFLREELMPYVNREFRTDTADRTIVGFSRGADVAIHTLLTTPDAFTRYVAIDNYYEEYLRLEEALSARTKTLPKRVYLTSRIPRSGLRELADRLQSKYAGIDVTYGDAHPRHVAAGPDGITRGLIAVFNKASIYETLLPLAKDRAIGDVIAEYRRLKEKGGTNHNFAEPELVELGNSLVAMRRPADAVLIYRLNLESYPRSAHTFSRLGTAYDRLGDKAAALENFRRAVQLNPNDRYATDAIKRLEGR
jgi:Putative esterase/Tetratricopeptide repeat